MFNDNFNQPYRPFNQPCGPQPCEPFNPPCEPFNQPCEPCNQPFYSPYKPRLSGLDVRVSETGKLEAVPGAAANSPSPRLYKLKAWNLEPISATVTTHLEKCSFNVAYIQLNEPIHVCEIVINIFAPGCDLISGENFAGIYSLNGNRIASTGDTAALLAGKGFTGLPLLHPVILPVGIYFIVFLTNGAIPPMVWSAPPNMQSISAPLLFGTINVKAEVLPPALPLPSGIAGNCNAIWVGLR